MCYNDKCINRTLGSMLGVIFFYVSVPSPVSIYTRVSNSDVLLTVHLSIICFEHYVEAYNTFIIKQDFVHQFG